jgi:hypothetical protein
MTRTIDPFDELAAMFLTTPSSAAERPSASLAGRANATGVAPVWSSKPETRSSPIAPTIELLLVGHLPVRGGLWLTPYADAVARERGCTALLRLDGDGPSVQVLRGRDELTTSRQPASFDEAVQSLAPAVNHWVVRAASDSTASDLLACGAPQLTILTSGDEAATVAAYQLIRDLATQAERDDAAMPAIGLAIVGGDPEYAVAVVERLNRTTVSFLGVEVRLAACVSRIDASIKSTRHMMFTAQASPKLADVLATVTRARSQQPLPAAPAVIGRVYGGHPFAKRMSGDRESHADDARTQRVAPLKLQPRAEYEACPRTQPSSSFDASANARPFTAPAIKLPPKPVAEVESKEPERAHESDARGPTIPLAHHVGGLVSLPVRMPGHERVEVAVDSAGRMHLLCHEFALREARIVEHWARAHRELLSMACPQYSFDAASRVIIHIFTDQPVALADLHGTDLRLHVLAPVSVNGQTAWYAAPLNAAH